ncbi:MAG TPA: hypothetical protein VFB84_10025 [Micromonosporaceae bacterium]|nr:hypothetical protein [Micromonosporaceae bacterium]
MAQPAPVVADDPGEQLLDAFVAYLAAERGLAASTIGSYRGVAFRFVATESDWPEEIAGLCAEQVSAFVLAEAARCSAGSLNNVTTGLQGYCSDGCMCGVIRQRRWPARCRLLRAGGIVGCRERRHPISSAGCWQAVTGVPT